jgi:deoxycytidylate deaminase
MEFDRPSWEEYFLQMADTASLRADCRRRKVGAVVVHENRVVGTGYNGTDPGAPGCLAGACPRGLLSYAELPAFGSYANCISRHAEVNAVRAYRENMGRGRRMASDVTVYVNNEPCNGCINYCGNEGISTIVSPTSIFDLKAEYAKSTQGLSHPRLSQPVSLF